MRLLKTTLIKGIRCKEAGLLRSGVIQLRR
jgi:hypothetical protein